jgi:hypothetical protein
LKLPVLIGRTAALIQLILKRGQWLWKEDSVVPEQVSDVVQPNILEPLV